MTENSPILSGVIGWPIGHSKSPLIHTHWIKTYGISGHYVPLGIRPENFESAVFGDDGSIRADNTDGYGFLENIRSQVPDWRGSNGPALVLGAGGASRAVVSALLSDGAPEIRLTNRTRHRADIIKDQFGAKVTVVDWAKASEAVDGAATIVNTTSLGCKRDLLD